MELLNKNNSQLPIYILLILISYIWFLVDSIASLHLDWGGDYAGYLLQAKSIHNQNIVEFSNTIRELISLTDGQRYEFAQTPGNWGYPVFLSFFEFFHEYDIKKLKQLNLLLHLSFLFVAFKIFRIYINQFQSLMFTSLFAFLPIFLEFHYKLLSEMLFAFLMIFGIYMNYKSELYKQNWYIYEAIIFGLAFLVRRQGALWLIVYLIVSIFKEKKISKQSLLYSFYFFLPFVISFITLRVNPVGNISSSAGEWSNFTTPNIDTLIFIFKEIGFIATRYPNNISAIFGVLFFAFILFGFLKEPNVRNTFLIFYIIFHFFYSPADTQRYWMPIIILFVIQILINFNSLLGHRLATPILSILFLLTSIYWLNSFADQRNYYLTSNGPNTESFVELTEFIQFQNENTLFIFHSPRTFYYFTNKKSYRLGDTVYANSIFVCEKGLTSKCTDKRFIKLDSIKKTNIFENESFILFQLNNE